MATNNTKVKVLPGQIDYDEVRRKAGNTNEALGNVPKGAVGTAGNPYIDMGEKIGTGGYSRGGNSTPTTSMSPNANPYKDQLKSLRDAQLASTMAGLDKSKNASLSNLSAEKAKIEPLYQKDKMQAGVTAKQTARSFGEYMAQRGGGAGASGIGGQGELMNNLGYQNQYGAIDQAETGAMTENARNVTDIGNAYNSDVAGANASVESQYLQNYITQMNQDRAFGLQQQQVNNQSDQWSQSFNADQSQRSADNSYRQQAADLAATQFEKQFGLSVGQAIGNYQGNPTLAAQAQNIQQEQFAASQAQNSSQFDQSLAQGNYQFGANLANNQSQFNSSNDLNWFNANTSRANVTQVMPGTSGSGGTVSGGSMPAKYSNWVNDAATKNGISPSILAGLIQTESSWNPNAVNSSSGATGLGQFLPSTARDEGLSNSKDAQSSIYAAAACLAKRIQWAGGDVNKGIMGYGEGTTAYLNKVLGASKSFSISSGGGGTPIVKAPTAAELKAGNTSEAYSDIQKALDSGSSPNTVKQGILSHSSEYASMGININTLISHVDAIAKSWGEYPATFDTQATPRENPALQESKAASAWNSLNKMWGN